MRKRSKPRCRVIAGPNGAGKTTFARRYLANEVGIVHCVNADLIAAGLSPLAPSSAALRAVGDIRSTLIAAHALNVREVPLKDLEDQRGQ